MPWPSSYRAQNAPTKVKRMAPTATPARRPNLEPLLEKPEEGVPDVSEGGAVVLIVTVAGPGDVLEGVTDSGVIDNISRVV